MFKFTKHLFLYKSGEIIPAVISNALDLTTMVFVEQTNTPQIVIVIHIEVKECNNKTNDLIRKYH